MILAVITDATTLPNHHSELITSITFITSITHHCVSSSIKLRRPLPVQMVFVHALDLFRGGAARR